jgi:CheY-like chemotaxis protein
MSQFRYLYVEDDPSSRDVMQILMTDIIKVKSLVIFEDSHDFMTRIEALVPSPNIIFIDLHVKPDNGFELAAKLRSSPKFRHARIVAVTAGIVAQEIEKLKQSSFDGLLAKPFDLLSFPDQIRRLEAGESVWQVE